MSRLGFVRGVLTLGTFIGVGALLVTSCLTPEFDFESDTVVGTGGAGGDGGNPAANCTNDRQDGNETDVDCGGNQCSPCGTDDKCIVPGDCSSQVCTSSRCQAPACDDRVKNGNESDIDCGGDCEPCAIGLDCVVAQDCELPPEGDSALTQCIEGTCTLLCSAGTDDCNQNASDSCETNLLESLDHCGECGNPCRPDNATAECFNGTCLIDSCAPGFADINGDPADGCEIDTNTDPDYCGPQRVECSDHNGTPGCSEGACTIDCDMGFDDCNDDPSDGCEIDLMSDVLHCNQCDNDCPEGDGTEVPHCVGGVCGLTDCPAGLGDCDGDGTCTDDLTVVTSCGTCGTTCNVPNGTPACESGGCVIDDCNTGFDDCVAGGGCETNLNTNPDRCGNCATSCSGTNVQTRNCNMGTCAPSCQSGWCPAANPANGCTVPKGTPENCADCGDVCGVSTPFCTPQGCRSYLPITVVNDTTTATASTVDLDFNHALQTSAAANDYRAVVLLLSDKANPNGLPPDVTYGGEPMTLALDRFANQAWAGIYYMLDADLPSAVDTYTVSVPGASGNQQRWAARVIELINVNQSDPVIDAQFVSQGGSTCSNAAATLSLTTSVDAWVASILTESRVLGEDPAPTGNNLSAFTVLTTAESTVSQGRAFATGATRNVSWVGCSAQAWAHVAVAFRPEGQSP